MVAGQESNQPPPRNSQAGMREALLDILLAEAGPRGVRGYNPINAGGGGNRFKHSRNGDMQYWPKIGA